MLALETHLGTLSLSRESGPRSGIQTPELQRPDKQDRVCYSGLGALRVARHPVQLPGGNGRNSSSSRLEEPQKQAANRRAPAETLPARPDPQPPGREKARERLFSRLRRLGSRRPFLRLGAFLPPRGQRVPRPLVRLRPRARAPPRKEAGEAAASLRRFY